MSSFVDRVLALTRSRPATLGTGRLVCIDGPAGSGKTTLAGEVAASSGAGVVHLDDLYPGWDGLGRIDPLVLALLAPLADGSPGSYPRYDWALGEYAETHTVAPAPLLVLEGVGAGNRAWAGQATVLVWVEAPPATRLERGLARDGVDVEDRWRQWLADEDVLFAREGTRHRADLVLET